MASQSTPVGRIDNDIFPNGGASWCSLAPLRTFPPAQHPRPCTTRTCALHLLSRGSGGDDTVTHTSCVTVSTRTAILQAPVVSAVLRVTDARPWRVTACCAGSVTTPSHCDPAN